MFILQYIILNSFLQGIDFQHSRTNTYRREMSTNAYKYVCKTKDSKKAGINGSYGTNSRLQIQFKFTIIEKIESSKK